MMTEDMYLSLAIELFEKGTWSKEVFIKRITLYAKEKNMDMSVIDEIINRLTKPREYTIDEKRKFLSFVTIAGDELKYGDAALEMSDEMVEKFYEMEKESLDKDKFEALHNMNTTNVLVETTNDVVVEEVKEDSVQEIIPEVFAQEEPAKEEVIVIDNNTKLFGNKSIRDIIIGNYTASDILGNNDTEKEARFNYLVQNVKFEDLREVANSLINKMEPSYCLNFTIEWEKLHKEELNNLEEVIEVKNNSDVVENKEEVLEVQEEPKVEEVVSDSVEPVIEMKEEIKQPDVKEEIIEEVLTVQVDEEKPKLVIPKLSFDSYGEDDLPVTEEEYVAQAENITKTEKDSTVRKVNISPERLAKLKKTKDRAINCSLKTAMVILAFKLAGPFIGVGAVASYMYFAEEIRCGTFNPKNPIGKAIKYTVEKVMNIGIKKDKENERGMAK